MTTPIEAEREPHGSNPRTPGGERKKKKKKQFSRASLALHRPQGRCWLAAAGLGGGGGNFTHIDDIYVFFSSSGGAGVVRGVSPALEEDVRHPNQVRVHILSLCEGGVGDASGVSA